MKPEEREGVHPNFYQYAISYSPFRKDLTTHMEAPGKCIAS